METEVHKRDFSGEFVFKASKSSGPGGQHVNTTNSRVSLSFDVSNSQLLTESEKLVLQTKESGKINSAGILQLHAEDNRSQLRNKDIVVRRFYQLLKKTFVKVKVRKPTKPSLSAINKRLDGKKAHAEKKIMRKRII